LVAQLWGRELGRNRFKCVQTTSKMGRGERPLNLMVWRRNPKEGRKEGQGEKRAGASVKMSFSKEGWSKKKLGDQRRERIEGNEWTPRVNLSIVGNVPCDLNKKKKKVPKGHHKATEGGNRRDSLGQTNDGQGGDRNMVLSQKRSVLFLLVCQQEKEVEKRGRKKKKEAEREDLVY